MQNEPELRIDDLGNKRWYLNNKLHREGGPAVEYASGNKIWYLNGQRHRTDGHAVEWENGDKEWYLNHRYYTFEEWLKRTPLPSQEKVKLRLKYGQ